MLAANLPQLWIAFKEGNLADLSLGTWLLSMTDGLVWGGYALSQGDIPILIYAVLQLTTSGLIVAASGSVTPAAEPTPDILAWWLLRRIGLLCSVLSVLNLCGATLR